MAMTMKKVEASVGVFGFTPEKRLLVFGLTAGS